MTLRQARDLYVATAVIVFNLLVLFAATNLVILGGRLLKSELWSLNPISEKYKNVQLGPVYPGKTQQQIDALLNETWSRPFVYEPFTQFREAPYHGQYVNVDEDGFRHS